MNRAILSQKDRRCGFTLLEIIVALGLSVIIVGAISSAIRLHLITLEKQSKNIEYKQVARSVLMMVSNDLRNAIQYKPVDLSVLEQLASSQQASLGNTPPAGDTGDLGGGVEGGAAGGGDPSGGGGSSASEEESAPVTMDESMVEGRPTLVGNNLVLSIDISRVPRLDEYNSLTAGNVRQLPSDVKNVTYFVSPSDNNAVPKKFDVVSTAAQGGLYRRAIDRAFATYQDEESPNPALDAFADLVAPEIAQIAFRYFDGEDFVDEWDSVENGGFPPAIEVTVVIDPERMNPQGGNYQYGGFNQETMQRFRLVVNLPTANGGGG